MQEIASSFSVAADAAAKAATAAAAADQLFNWQNGT